MGRSRKRRILTSSGTMGKCQCKRCFPDYDAARIKRNISHIVLRMRREFDSRVAMFYIELASRSETYAISLEDACAVWRQHKIVLTKIKRRCQWLGGSWVEQNISFALNALYYFMYDILMWKDENVNFKALKRHYQRRSKNFIISLTDSARCNCHGYTQYIVAAAEEMGYDLISSYATHMHLNIAISSGEGGSHMVGDSSSEYYPLFRGTVLDFGYGNTSLPDSKVDTILDVGFDDNFHVKVQSALSQDDFKRRFLPTNVTHWAMVNVSSILCKIICNQSQFWRNDEWNKICSLVRMITSRENATQEKFRHSMLLMSALWRIPLDDLISLSKHASSRSVFVSHTSLLKRVISEIGSYSLKLGYYPHPQQVYDIISSAYYST